MIDDAAPPEDGWFDSLNVVPMRAARSNGGAHRDRKRVARSSAGAPPRSDLPVIQMTTRLHESVDASVEALGADSELYQRDARLVRVVRVAEADAAQEHMTAGTPQIRPVPVTTLRERLTRVATYQKLDARNGEWTDAVPNDRIVTAVEARGEWPLVRALTGVIETPSMRPDGSILETPGYDASTGYVYLPGCEYPRVPSSPTLDDARRALVELHEPWTEFPMRAEADRYVPIAALLTLVARPAIGGACPAALFDASTPGSGKTLCARGVSMLAHGRESALMSWPSDAVELEKILASYALRAASIITFDNVVGAFGGGPLDKVLTCADRVELRVLGQSEVPSLSWRAVILATGNNLVLGGDTARRVLVCRLEPMMERPEERTGYAISDLVAWCREHHARLVVAALTVLRAYVVAGRPAQHLAGWGSYEQWRDLIASAIVWAGGADVMACRPTVAGEENPEIAALRTVLEQLPRIAPDGVTAARVIQALYPPERMRNQAPPDGYDDLRDALEVIAPPSKNSVPNAQKLGAALRRHRRRVVAGRYLDRSEKLERTGSALWIVREAGR